MRLRNENAERLRNMINPQFFGTILLSAFAMALLFGVLGLLYYRRSTNWRQLAPKYTCPWRDGIRERWVHFLVYRGEAIAQGYSSVSRIGVQEDGIALRMMFPDSIFCKPLFIPFGDISLKRQAFFLHAHSAELELKKTPGVRLVIPLDQYKWAIGEADHQDWETSQPSAYEPALRKLMNLRVLMLGAAVGFTIFVAAALINSAL